MEQDYAAAAVGHHATRVTIAATLRFLASGWIRNADDPSSEDDRRWLRETADQIEHTTPEDWWCCPLCEETRCDEGCPLAPLRAKEYAKGWGLNRTC